MNSEIFIFNLLGATKEEAIKEILDALEIEKKDEAFQDIMRREALSPTLISPYIAIPHAKSRAVDKLTYAIARSIDGVVWNSGRPKIIILTLSPLSASGEHVIFLSHVAAVLNDEENVRRILSAESPEEMEEVFYLL